MRCFFSEKLSEFRNKDSKGHYIGTMAVSFRLSDLAVRYREISDLYNVNFALFGVNNNIIFESKDGICGRDKKLFEDLSTREINAAEEFMMSF